MTDLLYGLITGILFGFFLQKGRVLRYDKQIAALLLQFVPEIEANDIAFLGASISFRSHQTQPSPLEQSVLRHCYTNTLQMRELIACHLSRTLRT